MARIEVKREVPGKTADVNYKAIGKMVEKAGYKIFKRRDIAYLLVCEGELQGSPASLNISVPFTAPNQVVINLGCDAADDAALSAEVDRLFTLLQSEY